MVRTDARGELSGGTPETIPVGPDLVSGPSSVLREEVRTRGPALQQRVRPEVRFALAKTAHDPAIRRLLRDNPMRGAISVSFEREPSYFAHGADDDQTIVGFEDGRLVGLGRCAVRPRFINGELRRVGYLGELRLDVGARQRRALLRGGYQFFRELQGSRPADFYFTSIAADNVRARRFLERGLPGMPRYEFLTEFVTLLISVGRAVTPLPAANPTECARFLERQATRHQLAASWSAAELTAMDELIELREGTNTIAAAALWDQRAWRQTVIRGYSRALRLARPFVNFGAAILGAPRLLPIGAVVPAAFLSPLAAAAGHEARLPDLIRAAFEPAQTRGVRLLIVGFAADDPRLAIVRRGFRVREYRTRLYRVRWPDAPDLQPVFDGRPILPEVALL